MRERQRQARGERRRLGDTSLFPGKDPHALVDTGELELVVEGRYGRRAAIGDGKNRRLEDHLNEVVIALIEAAVDEKAFRAAREREQQAQAERERTRAKAKERERVRRARIGRLERFAEAAQRHKRLVVFRGELREAIGHVDTDSELSRWLAWIDQHIDHLDVLKRFRDRQPRLTLYHCLSTYSLDLVLARGFENEDTASDEDQEAPKSVSLTDVPMEGIYGGTVCVMVDVPEDAVLPYESVGHFREYRQFRVPAEIANRFERRVYSP
jgi:hypothetical protein